jgi:DNA-binding NtrC family response regulator
MARRVEARVNPELLVWARESAGHTIDEAAKKAHVNPRLKELLRVDPLLPVVIVTGNRDLDVARGTLKQGAFDYVAKPFDMNVLERIVGAAVSRRGHAAGRG